MMDQTSATYDGKTGHGKTWNDRKREEANHRPTDQLNATGLDHTGSTDEHGENTIADKKDRRTSTERTQSPTKRIDRLERREHNRRRKGRFGSFGGLQSVDKIGRFSFDHVEQELRAFENLQ